MNASGVRPPKFRDYDAVYFADACEPLERAVEEHRIDLHTMVHGAYPGTVLPDDVLTGVGSVGFWDAVKPQDWGLEWHRNEGIEITFLDRGSVEFSTRDAEWTLEPEQFTVTRPWQEHRVGRPNIGASRLHWIIIDVGVRRPHQEWVWPEWINLAPADLDRLSSMLQHNEAPVWAPDPAISRSFAQLRQIVLNPDSAIFESELRLAITQLLLSLLGAANRTMAHKPTDSALRSPRRAVRMLLEELDGHLNHPWTLAEMASAARLGRSKFSQFCRELTNMTPIEYLTSRRVALAARLLTETSLSITDIAIESGFQSSQYFATVFRRQMGVSASEYRLSATVTSPELELAG